MSILADVLLSTEEKWMLHRIYAGSTYTSLLSEVLQNYNGSFLYLTLSRAILSPQLKLCS